MPRKPWALKGGRLTLTDTSEVHLLTGCCLLSGCQVCAGNESEARALGKAPYAVRDIARAMWEKHRERLLAIWRDPAGPRPGASRFSAEGYRGAGRTGCPCWAERYFEGAKSPRPRRASPSDRSEA